MRQITLSTLNDAWMDNGLETLFSILNQVKNQSFDAKIENNSLIITINNFGEFRKILGNIFEQRRENLIISILDKETGEIKEIRKNYVLIQENKKIKGKVAFKEGLYNQKSAADTISRILNLIIEEGKRNCVICGKPFSKPVKKLQQAAYPFVTKTKSLSGIRSYKDNATYSLQEYFEDFCPTCYLRGLTEWSDDGIIYQIDSVSEKAIVLLPNLSSLDKLVKFKTLCRNLQLFNKNGQYQNLRENKNSEKIETTAGAFNTLLFFYEKLFTDTIDETEIGRAHV